MNRDEFIKICGVFGLGIPLHVSAQQLIRKKNIQRAYKGKVLVIGAGAAGLSTAYFLQQQGVEFEVLEASSSYGGRIRVNREFADFDIPLGAEWIETQTKIFDEIVNDPSINVDVKTVRDRPDYKFMNSSWIHFFETYITPSIKDRIRFNRIVQKIDYQKKNILVHTKNKTYTADKVVVCVPLKMLQTEQIEFTPLLPKTKTEVIKQAEIWSGFKAFFEFSKPFYQKDFVFDIQPKTDGEKLYYDATLGQQTDRHVLGLFAVGKPAQDYIQRKGDDLKGFMLNELDRIYGGQASKYYLKHLCQNWDDEPFINGAYLSDYTDWKTVKILGEPVSKKLYFAGGAFTNGEDWVSVHTAAQSAKEAVHALIAQ